MSQIWDELRRTAAMALIALASYVHAGEVAEVMARLAAALEEEER